MKRVLPSGACSLALALALWPTPLPAATPGAWLGELSWPEAQARLKTTPVVVLPFGPAAKAHGPHLPMNADAKVADYLCARAVEAQDVVVAPPIAHGWLPAFRQLPGTEVKDSSVFIHYVDEVARSLVRSGARRLVFLNTSIAKAGGLPLSIVARDLREEIGTLRSSYPGTIWRPRSTARCRPSARARTRTRSRRPSTSSCSRRSCTWKRRSPTTAAIERRTIRDIFPGMFSRDPADPAYTETGVFGDPRRATAEKGKRALAILTAQWLKALSGFSGEPLRAETRAR